MPSLYEDQFVNLSESSIEIKNYYMPSRRCRRVPIGHIGVLYFEEQQQSKVSLTRVWGRGHGLIYWALDLRRAIGRLRPSTGGRSNVVVDIGGDQRLGFTVVDIDAFMDKMRECLDYHVIIVNKINL